MLSLATEPGLLMRSLFGVYAKRPRTLLNEAVRLPLSRRNRRAVLSRAVLGRLATPLGNARKIRRTDFCNRPSPRAPVDRLTPEPAARTAETASRLPPRAQTPNQGRDNGVGPPHGNPAPGKETFDDAPLASADSQATLPQKEKKSTAFRSTTLPRRFQPRAKASDSTSDAFCRALAPA